MKTSCVIVLAALIVTGGQTGSTPATDIYKSLPEADREQFRVAFERRISLEIEGRWSDLYESFDVERNPITKQKFVKEMDDSNRLLRYIPLSITFMPPSGDWAVEGCAEFRKPPRTGQRKGQGSIAIVDARRTPSGWRFGYVLNPVGGDEPKEFFLCSLPH
jgi:hypothetical protein